MIRIVSPQSGDPEGPVSPGRAWALAGLAVALGPGVLAVGHCVERWTDADTASTAIGVFAVVWLLAAAAVVLVRRGEGDR